MPQAVINPSKFMLSGDALDQVAQPLIKMADPALIARLQAGDMLVQKPEMVVDYVDLPNLVLEDFAVVFVRDYGGNGKGSLWWKHPTAGFISCESRTTLWRDANFGAQMYNGVGSPDWELIRTINLPRIPDDTYILRADIMGFGSASAEFPGGVRIKIQGDDIVNVADFTTVNWFDVHFCCIQDHNVSAIRVGVNGALQFISNRSILQDIVLKIEAKTSKVFGSQTVISMFDLYLQR